MQRESRILLATGFLLLFATVGWVGFKGTPSVVHPVSAFLARGEQAWRGQPVVGIVFSPRDCGGLIEQLRLWNEPYLAREARVHGLLRVAPGEFDSMWKVAAGAGLRFPVNEAKGERLAAVQRALGYRGGSFVVVFDRDGRVRRTVPLAELSDVHARAEILDFVRSLRELPEPAPGAGS